MNTLNILGKLKIDDEIFRITESYIRNGTGFTFQVYRENDEERFEYIFINTSYNKMYLFGRVFNYKIEKIDEVTFNVYRYDDWTIEKTNIGIKIKDKDVEVCHYYDDSIDFDKIFRRQKQRYLKQKLKRILSEN